MVKAKFYHIYGDGSANVVEFIVQTETLPYEVTLMGSCGILENIGGNVIDIVKLE